MKSGSYFVRIDDQGYDVTVEVVGGISRSLTEDPKKRGEYQPVTWQEAIQAWVEGKTVTVSTMFGIGSREVKKSRGSSITEYEITKGTWYVED